jgi:hypothetical protein
MVTDEIESPECAACIAPAEFETPYGPFCLTHTREILDADEELWLPQPVRSVWVEVVHRQPSRPPRVG